MAQVLDRPFAVVAYDTGAANHILSWLTNEQPVLCLAGPARALWQSHLKKFGRISALPEPDLETALCDVDAVITGTGWGSRLEHDARKLALARGIHSIAVIDHWTNYADRFVRDGEQVLPDEIWVSDAYAARIARATFPGVYVVEKVNAYLAGLVEQVGLRQSDGAVKGNDRVLYVLEPIRHVWGPTVDPGEFLALNYFIAHRQRAPVSRDAEIRLRPHPSDAPGKYDVWIDRQANPRISLDQSSTLADAIAWSNVVVGCQTYAMVVALACGRTVISSIPDWAPPCVLPHQGVLRLAEVIPST